MASFLLRHPILSPFTLTSTLCLTSIVAYPIVSAPFRQRHRLDTIPSSAGSRQYADYKNNAKTPLIKKDGKLNVRALRQISAGSILGLVGGLAVSVFSKPLALLIGLLVFGVQALESRGIHLVPTERIQRYFKGINVQSAIQDNVAFKLSFGITFALASFGSF